MMIGFAFWGTVLTPPEASKLVSALYPTVGTIIGALVGFGIIYLAMFFRAPYRQRNECQKQVVVWGKHEDTISHFASIIKEADALAIINAGERGVTDEILQEAIIWTRKAINDICGKLGEVRNQQIRTIAELPLDGELKDEHFKVPYARSAFGHELGLIRDRHYKVYYWLKEFIETSPPNPDTGGFRKQ